MRLAAATPRVDGGSGNPQPSTARACLRAAFATAIASAFCFGCARASRTAQLDEGDNSLDNLKAQIMAEVGDAPCGAVLECRTLPVGAKPCGGPQSYLAYSIVRSDTLRLAELVSQYTNRERALNQTENRTSDCSLVQNPGVVCRAGRCVPAR